MGNLPEIDEFDRKIIRILEQDGRATNAELAEQVGLSPSSCQRRVKEMEALGVIRGYRADIAPEASGRGFTVFVAVRMALHRREELERFEEEVRKLPQVSEVHSIAGSFEYLVRVNAADLEDYKRVHRGGLSALPGVSQITSYISLHQVLP